MRNLSEDMHMPAMRESLSNGSAEYSKMYYRLFFLCPGLF